MIRVLFLLLVLVAIPSHAQPAKDIIDASQVLCAIQYRYTASENGLRGAIVCGDGSFASDFFFLGRHWRAETGDQADCDCDPDFDGLTGCEEITLCLNSVGNDTDGDCLSDGLEILLGLNPLSSDSNGDGTLDGDEDLDMDGILERDEDFDLDALTNCQEATVGIDPATPDTDGDGYPDGAEVEANTLALLSDPRDPESVPKLLSVSTPVVQVVLPASDLVVAAGSLNTVVSLPPTQVVIPGSETSPEFALNTVVSFPPTLVVIPGSEIGPGLALNTVVSFPPATVVAPSSLAAVGDVELNTSVAYPPTQVEFNP